MTLTTLTSTLAHADVGYELKTVVVTDGESFVRAVVPASEHVDLHRLAHALGRDGALRPATEAELAAGSHEESLRLRTADLLRLADAQVADISRP